jgi:hypothetical protein
MSLTTLKVEPGISSASVKNIPETWDRAWFRRFIRDFLMGGDVRNAIAGTGITITGNLASPFATISATGGGGGTQGYLGTFITNAPASGVINNFAPAGFGAGVGRLDVDTTAGNVELTGLTAGTDGQLLNVRNTGANNLILDSLNGGSAAANQFELPGQMYIPQYDSILLCYYGGAINKWVMA